MTVEQYIAAQKRKLSDGKIFFKPFERAVRNVLALQTVRIFTDGKNSHGSLIGHGAYNDNKPLYVNPDTSPGRKFKPAGKPFEFREQKSSVRNEFGFRILGKSKPGKTRVVRDTRVKTRWFSSYKEYRRVIGKKTDRVNLVLSGDLQFDFNNSRSVTAPIPTKISNVEYQVRLKRLINEKKVEGLEDKYGQIFHLTKQEKEKFYETLEFNFKKALIDG